MTKQLKEACKRQIRVDIRAAEKEARASVSKERAARFWREAQSLKEKLLGI